MKNKSKLLAFNLLPVAFGFTSVYAQDSSQGFAEPILSHIQSSSDAKTVLKYGIIQGYVHVPEGIDPRTVVVQVAGVNKFNLTPEDFYTTVDAEGYFSFENTFSVGSAVQLIFWDQQGILAKRALLAYASKDSNVYDITLQKNYDIYNLAQVYGITHNFTKAGFCGQITGYSPLELKGSELYLQDNQSRNTYEASYFDDSNYPNKSQKYLSETGGFCFFNIESPDQSYVYYARLKLNDGTVRTFPLYLPDYTFPTNIELDGKSSLFRPVTFYSLKALSKESAHSGFVNWDSVKRVKYTTNFDYDSIEYISNIKQKPVYFPIDNEFVHVDYSFTENNSEHFFVLHPRTALFNKKIASVAHGYRPGQVYVDYHDPVVLKVLNPQILNEAFPKGFEKLSDQYHGSAIVNIDTSQYAFDSKSLHVYLRNLSGQNVSSFVPLENTGSHELTGYFAHIPLGYYELFVTVPTSESHCDDCTTFNENEKLIWSYLVFSAGKNTQIIANISDNKLVIESKLAKMSNKDVYVTDSHPNKSQNITVETIPMGKVEMPKFYELPNIEKLISENSLLSADVNKLCYAEKPQKIVQKKPTFMNIVPLVSYLPPAKVVLKYITRR